MARPTLRLPKVGEDTNIQCSYIFYFSCFFPFICDCMFCLFKYNDHCHRLQGRAQGNVFKHPKIIRKKYISFRTSNNFQHFVETSDLKIADHYKT